MDVKSVVIEQMKNEKSLTGDYYFINLYKHGDKPFWTMHHSYIEAVRNAGVSDNCLHIGLPINKIMFN